jgi:hypothetical protein
MAINLLWLSPVRFKFYDTETQQESVEHFMPDANILDRGQREELLLWQQEGAEKEFRAKAGLPPKQPNSKQFQHDLGDVLQAVSESNQRREEVGHGRYW